MGGQGWEAGGRGGKGGVVYSHGTCFLPPASGEAVSDLLVKPDEPSWSGFLPGSASPGCRRVPPCIPRLCPYPPTATSAAPCRDAGMPGTSTRFSRRRLPGVAGWRGREHRSHAWKTVAAAAALAFFQTSAQISTGRLRRARQRSGRCSPGVLGRRLGAGVMVGRCQACSHRAAGRRGRVTD